MSLFVLALTVLSTTQLTQSGASAFGAVSPDGKKVVYVDGSTLFLRDLGSGQIRRLSVDGYGAMDPSFSPDGEAVYFQEFQLSKAPGETHPGFWVRLPLGSGAKATRVGTGQYGAVAVSPDGKSLAALRNTTNLQRSLSVVGIDGSHERTLTSFYAGWYYNRKPAWSPDGTMIVTAKATPERIVMIAISAATGEIKEFSSWPRQIGGIAWPARGNGLFAILPSSERDQIWRLDIPTGKWTQVTHDPDGFNRESLSATDDGLTLLASRAHVEMGFWDSLYTMFAGGFKDLKYDLVLIHLKGE